MAGPQVSPPVRDPPRGIPGDPFDLGIPPPISRGCEALGVTSNQLLSLDLLQYLHSGEIRPASLGRAEISSRTPTLTSTGEGVAFLNSTYDEALALTRRARDYLATREPLDRQDLVPAAQLVSSCESMRLTARLTHCMAWLLVQRAVEAGELTREEASDETLRLGDNAVCEMENDAAREALPDGLAGLLDESLVLYRRVARLDATLDQE